MNRKAMKVLSSLDSQTLDLAAVIKINLLNFLSLQNYYLKKQLCILVELLILYHSISLSIALHIFVKK